MTPFQVVYGKEPPSLPQYIKGSSNIEALDTNLTERTQILQQLKQKLAKAQDTMKKFADQRRIPHPFKEGDFVYVKLRPYRQTSVAGRRVHKLSKRFYGPYQIIKAVGDVAFELALPPDSRIHPVFHVSKLKSYHQSTPPLELPPTAKDNQPLIQPLAIIGWHKTTTTGEDKVLIQWEGLPPEDTSWELLSDIRSTYPNLNLEDKVLLEEEEDVMNPAEVEEVPYEEGLSRISGRAKRNKNRPKYLNDYV